MATQNVSLSTDTTATVQPGGPRLGFFGDIFFNVQGSANGSNASFGVADFDLSTLSPSITPADVEDAATLDLVQSNAGFTAPGAYSVYYTPDSGVPFADLAYVGQGNGIDAVDADLTGLELLGSFDFPTDGDVNSGTVDTVSLTLTDTVKAAIVAELNDDDLDDVLRLVFTPDDATVAATYSGSSENFDGTGPTLNFTITDDDGGGDALTAPYTFDFETDFVAEGWSVFSVDADTASIWFPDSFSGDNFAEVNAFGDDAPADDWLISPAFDLDATEGETVSFFNAKNFEDNGIENPEVDFQYSTDYTGSGDPTLATWISLPYTFSTGGFEDTFSGEIDVSDVAGNEVYFAFQYTSSGTGPGSSALFQIDDFALQAGAAPTLVINEVDADTPGSDAAEFVELFDGGAGNTPLDGLVVVFFNGSDDASYEAFDLDGFSTDENGFFVLGNPGVANVDLIFEPGGFGALQNGADAVALYEGDAADFPGDTPATTENLIDAVVYDTSDPDDAGLLAALGQSVQFDENAGGDDDNESNSRVPDATGGFVTQAPTPGESNEAPTDFTDRLISEVQGVGDDGSRAGEAVRVTAVVTQVAPSGLGFYLQEEDSDRDDDERTSEGVFVASGAAVEIGQIVTVEGAVVEAGGETRINAQTVGVDGAGDNGALVTPIEVAFPVAEVTTNTSGQFIADLEAFEGALITVANTLTVSDLFTLGRFGDIGLSANGRVATFTQTNLPSVEGFAQFQQDQARATLTIDDGRDDQNPDPVIFPGDDGGSFPGGFDALDALRSGDTVDGVTGVVAFNRGNGDENYNINPTVAPVFENTNPRPEGPPEVGGRLQVGAFNVLNYFTTLDEGGNRTGPANDLSPRGADDAAELARQQAKLVEAIVTLDADVLGLIEIENDTDGEAIRTLVDAVNAVAGAGTYDFIDTGPIEGAQGGPVEGDAIKVAFIYQPDSVTPVGDFAILDETVDPRFQTVETQRPTLAQTFEENATGAVFTASANHFKSKGSIVDGDAAVGDGQGNNNTVRTNAAEALVDWLATDPTQSGDDDFIIVGDLNAYAMEDPIRAIKEGADDTPGTADDFVDPIEDYTFAFPISLDTAPQVQTFGSLDYALPNVALNAQVTGAGVWHTNADEPSVLDFNLEFNSDALDARYFNEDPFRASDHDAVLVGLDLDVPAPAVVANDDAAETGYHDPVAIGVLENDEGEGVSVAAVDTAATRGTVEIGEDGSIEYDPDGVFAFLAEGESASDSFGYTATDGVDTDEAEVVITLTGPTDDFDTGDRFSFTQGTNGGANRFGFDGEAFFVSGQGVRGRATFDDVDPYLVEATRLFDGTVEQTGTIDDQRLDDGEGPNIIRVTEADEVVIAGRGIGGRYRIGFEDAGEAETFRAFVERLFEAIDDNDAVATDAIDFRFDAGPARVFFDKANEQFGLTLDGGETQTRFDTLETFVEGVVEALGGEQTRDGRFNAERIAGGATPNRIRADDDGDLIVSGRSVGGRFEFAFEDAEAAETAADALATLFEAVDDADAIAFGDLLV